MGLWKRFSLFLLIFILIFSSSGIAFAADSNASGPIQFYIQNKTGSAQRINLSGPTNVWWTISTGRSTVELPAGTYQYSYWDCEQTISGTFVVKKKNSTLKLEKCKSNNASGGNSSDVQIFYQNKSGNPIRIHLEGPKNIWLTLATGRTKAELPAGSYIYSYYACEKTITSTFIVKKKNSTLKLEKCASGKSNQAGGDVDIFYQNKTGGSVRIQLVGPKTIWLTLAIGKTKAQLPAGTYKYSYAACDDTIKGTFVVKKKGNTLQLPKCKKDNKSGKTTRVSVNNQTRGTLSMYLNGPSNYTFYFSTGKTNIDISPGKYEYTVYGCGTSASGIKSFRGGKSQWQFWCQ